MDYQPPLWRTAIVTPAGAVPVFESSLAPGIVGALAPTGVIVLSGLLESEEVSVRAAYRAHGLALVRRLVRAGWSTLILGRCGKGLSVPGPALDT